LSWNRVCSLCLSAGLLTCLGVAPATAQTPPAVSPNDNRIPAGNLRSGVLTIHLEIAEGTWHPLGPDGESHVVYIFREAGHPLQNPGPLIRVPQGSEIQATILNTLPVGVTLHGFHERPGEDKDTLNVPPGATKEIQFHAGAPGAYFYWGTTSGNPLRLRVSAETQLAGALVIDSPGATPWDRIFVLGVWSEDPAGPNVRELATINGTSWPYTERFNFKVGETVHWRWLNATGSDHAMHLHGFYYHVDAMGTSERAHSFNRETRPLVVTQHFDPGDTFDMSWVPERAGRWLFHCHMLVHMLPPDPLPGVVPTVAHDSEHRAVPEAAGMGGLVIGITVQDDKPLPAPVWRAERKLQLIISERKDARPHFALKLQDADQPSPRSEDREQPALIGPPIILAQGQPVEIEVVNHLSEPTGIHWHGIELESYYDGVPGWTGTPDHVTPPVLPGKSFIARMTPPRAGTFIYHTHWHDRAQLLNGIYGPLIVLPRGTAFDPATDKTFLFSMGTFEPFGDMLLVNGNPQPAPLRLNFGKKYRLRFINIAPDNVAMRVSLRQTGVPVQWRIVAKDGADLPSAAVKMTTAEMGITVGETYDVEYEAESALELSLEVYLPGPKLRATQGLVFTPERPPRD
jgi:FtsP/CotA-like multicopper oxidase with cupredoxin domain